MVHKFPQLGYVVFGLGNPSVSVPRNEERTRPGSLTHVIIGAQAGGPIK